jgi:hypothetical protein
MDLPSILKQRLERLGYEQRDLAAAAQVTESYISPLFYYRELQGLRDPLHFRGPALGEGAAVQASSAPPGRPGPAEVSLASSRSKADGIKRC